VIGTGFWSNYQIPAWKELEGVEIVAVCDRNRKRAEEVAGKFGVPKVYSIAAELMENEALDFIDIITDVDTHAEFTSLGAEKGLGVICQKPMAPSLGIAQQMISKCKQENVRFFIHENFRWQAPVRALKKEMDQGVIGRPFKARVSFCSAFPVFENQPFLADLKHFILTDIGSHTLDICRFLFGEAKSLFCLTQSVNPKIKGEDVANVLMQMKNGLHCYAEMSYASILEKEAFPQTLVLVEGDKGSLHLTYDFELRVTTKQGTAAQKVEPVIYPWCDPAYAVVHSSIVDCNRNILDGLRDGKAETTGEDNLKTVQLVWAAYESAATNKVINF
ncbi:MAG TPA: Gfo/Idh/MocA family oxidoreductase, partial [Segetibacter sp.]|nr:Gfo/Idh/MocA family oxidoreductase [Segetibacter sp.]